MNHFSVPSVLRFALTSSIKLLGFAANVLLNIAISVLVFHVTLFWVLELVFSPGALKSARLARLSDCEAYCEWLFSRRAADPITGKNFLRLWGIEFNYV